MALLHRIEAIVVHHTASPASTTLADVDRWHAERGFAWSHRGRSGHVGYHLLVTASGDVLEGRPIAVQGAHSPGWNGRSIGVCCVGSFEGVGWFGMPEAQREGLVDLVDRLLRVHDLHPSDVYGHRETQAPGYTVCPGFDPEELRRALRARAEVVGP